MKKDNEILRNVGKVLVYIVVLLVFGRLNIVMKADLKDVIGGRFGFQFYNVMYPLVNIIFGFALSYESIFKLYKGQGKWKVDKLRMGILLVPMLFISFRLVIYYSALLPLRQLGDLLLGYYFFDGILPIVQVLTGILLVSCIDKKIMIEEV